MKVKEGNIVPDDLLTAFSLVLIKMFPNNKAKAITTNGTPSLTEFDMVGSKGIEAVSINPA
jgi:hypothetical protein